MTAHKDEIEHFFHLAAIYDMTASDEMNETMNVGGTRNAVELAGKLEVGHFHQVSSVAASGDYRGVFDESMFDEGQRLPSPYHRTKFESEKIVREESTVPWRVYRPAIVVGDSDTGAMDKVDGPYYFFPVLKRLRDSLPGWMPLVGVDLGDTNVVPVDYVASAMEHIAHKPGLDGQAFHLVNPEPQNTVGLINTFAAAAKAPQFAVPVDRSVTNLAADRHAPPRPAAGPDRRGLRCAPGAPGAQPDHRSPRHPTGGARAHLLPLGLRLARTEKALAGSGISVPDLDSYASPCGRAGRRCSTTRSRRDPRRQGARPARPSSSPAPPRASAWSPPSRSPRPAPSRSWSPGARRSSRPPSG